MLELSGDKLSHTASTSAASSTHLHSHVETTRHPTITMPTTPTTPVAESTGGLLTTDSSSTVFHHDVGQDLKFETFNNENNDKKQYDLERDADNCHNIDDGRGRFNTDTTLFGGRNKIRSETKSRDFTFFSVPNVPTSEHRHHGAGDGRRSITRKDSANVNMLISSALVDVFGARRRDAEAANDDEDDGDQHKSSVKHFTIHNGEMAKNGTPSGTKVTSAPNSPIPETATRPSPGGPFEIIQIVPPMTSRRNSGAISPINFRSSASSNRRFAVPTHFRSIPELTTSQLNLHRSNQFQASASYALAHCNEEILCYYNRLVSLIGWRPLVQSVSCRARVNWLIQAINWLYVAIIIVLLLSAYMLQFAACFRQDSIFVYDPLILGDESPTPPLLAYFERNKALTKSTTQVSWLFRSPNSSAEEFPDVSNKSLKSNSSTLTTSKVSSTITTEATTKSKTLSSSGDDFRSSLDGVTFRGKLFPVIITTAPTIHNRTMSKHLSDGTTMDLVNHNILSVFYPFIERYSNVSFHNTTPESSHHHEHLYRCRGGIGTYYIIPSMLHFIAFISMLRQMRRPETDRFHNLCVVNYILDTKVSGRDRASHKLTSSIRFWMLVGTISLFLTMFSHTVHLYYLIDDPVCFTFLQPSSDLGVNILKAVSLLLFGLIDFVCIAIFTTYALHCTLNIHFLKTNITALREKRIDFHEFAKNTEESKTSIDFLNCTHSIGVSILLVHFGTRLLVLLIDLCSKKVGFNLLTATAFVYWIALVIVPMIQAARVTEACIALRHIGHELRARPFCYQSAPYHDLDSLLNYTSTLHMRAKLLLIPVRSSCVATIALTLVFVFLILGQIDLIQF